jgi:hypothetical protein
MRWLMIEYSVMCTDKDKIRFDGWHTNTRHLKIHVMYQTKHFDQISNINK